MKEISRGTSSQTVQGYSDHPAATPAKTQNITLHNVHQGEKDQKKGAKVTETLVRTARSYGVSKMDAAKHVAATTLESPAIRSDRPAAAAVARPTKAAATAPSTTAAAPSPMQASPGTASVPPTKAEEEAAAMTKVATQMNLTLPDLLETRETLGKLVNILKNDTAKMNPGDTKKVDVGATMYFEKGAAGKINLRRIKLADDTSEAQTKYMKSKQAGEAREIAGTKMLALLSKVGVEVSDEIRNALPSKTSMGNPGVLKDTLQDALTKIAQLERKARQRDQTATRSEVVLELKGELSALDWNSPAALENLLRAGSPSSTKLAQFVQDAFDASAKQCAKTAVDAARSALNAGKGNDVAITAAHTALLDSLKQVSFTPEFERLAKEAVGAVNVLAGEKVANNPSLKTDPKFQTTVALLKDRVLANIILRAFVPEVMDQIALVSAEVGRLTEAKTGKAPPAEASVGRLADKMQKLFNGTVFTSSKMKGHIEEIKGTHPNYTSFLKDPAKNSLSGFTAFVKLKQEISME